jgi:ferredoxin
METVTVSYQTSEGTRTLRVPKKLLRVPGIERNPADERLYANEYPIEDFDKSHRVWNKYLPKAIPEFYDDYDGTAMRALKQRCNYFHRRKPKHEPDRSHDPTEDIRRKAFELGFVVAGFTRHDSRYIYAGERDKVRFPYTIVLGLELPYDDAQLTPSLTTLKSIANVLVIWVKKALELGEYLNSLGYRAQITEQARALLQPFAVEAGLGQMGANGQMLSPMVGSRMRMGLIFTDARITPDKPVDYGIPDLCKECQVCVRRCPGRALTSREVSWRGVTKYKTLSHRCMPIFARFDSCGVCMKVCPVQKYGLEAVMEHYIESGGEILGKGTDELEGYTLKGRGHFGPGELPFFAIEELVTPGVHAPRPLGKRTAGEKQPETVEY